MTDGYQQEFDKSYDCMGKEIDIKNRITIGLHKSFRIILRKAELPVAFGVYGGGYFQVHSTSSVESVLENRTKA